MFSDMNHTQMIVLGLATLASAIVTNGAAVGSGIFLLPVLGLAFSPKVALGLGAPIMLAANLVGIRNYWREWSGWSDLGPMVLSSAVGIGLGGFFLHLIPSDIFKLAIGLSTSGYALFTLARDCGLLPRLLDPEQRYNLDGTASCLAIGFVGGLATVMAHAGGVVWSSYYVSRRMDKRMLVGTIILLFTMTNLLKLITYMRLDILTPQSNLLVAAMFPLILLGSHLGNTMNKKVGQRLFRCMVLLLILAAGLGLLLS